MSVDLVLIVTSDHEAGSYTDHRHLVLGHTAVVAGVTVGQIGNGQQAGHLVDPHCLLGVNLDPISKPADQHRRIALRHKIGLAKSLTLFKIIAEDKVLYLRCN